MYDLRAILKRLKFPTSTTLAGRSFHSRMILTKNEYIYVYIETQGIHVKKYQDSADRILYIILRS